MSTAVMSKSQMASIQGLVGDTKSMLSAAELQRMRDISMKDEERVAKQKAEYAKTNADKLSKSQARKTKMLELEVSQGRSLASSQLLC